MPQTSATVDPEEIGRFAGESADWWDPEGSFRELHRLNRTRLDFIRNEFLAHFEREPNSLQPFAGLRLIDIGCGGGLVAEPMARLGFSVTGIDAGSEAIAAARAHAEQAGLSIDYRVAATEELAAAGQRFDALLALEVIEHMADPAAFFLSLGALLRPGGALIAATLNRTAKSFALAIVAGEYLLGWLPRGTHDWRKFVRPSELAFALRRQGMRTIRLAGISFDPLAGGWSLSRDLDVNYLAMAVCGNQARAARISCRSVGSRGSCQS